MQTKTIVFAIFASCVPFCVGWKWKDKRTIFKAEDGEIMDVTDFSVYYDLGTNETIKKMMPRPWYKPGWLLRLPFMGGRCDCEELKCTCCTGIRIEAVNFDRRNGLASAGRNVGKTLLAIVRWYPLADSYCIHGQDRRGNILLPASYSKCILPCAILKYDPQESMIDLEVMMNNQTLFRSSYSARNPPPFCVPIPVPYLPPGLMDMCVRLFDISVADQKLHICMDMDTRIDRAPILVLHFDCMDMSAGGVGLSKPSGSGSNTNLSTLNGTNTEPTQLDFDVYDPVTEKIQNTEPPFLNSVKYI